MNKTATRTAIKKILPDVHESVADIGVFGGSGLYSFLDTHEEIAVETPYGRPSAPIVIGEYAGKRVAFLPRHGNHHEFPPHMIPYRANAWAMKSLGVRKIIGPSAAGSLKKEFKPGDFVICDQFVDRTFGRASTFYDGPVTAHVSTADPYCAVLRALSADRARNLAITAHDSGTVVVIQGPRFSTRAESLWFARSGFDVINMTQFPECVLARELEMCYVNIALITDYDTGVDGAPSVSNEAVLKTFAENNDKVKKLILSMIEHIDPHADCECHHSMDGAFMIS